MIVTLHPLLNGEGIYILNIHLSPSFIPTYLYFFTMNKINFLLCFIFFENISNIYPCIVLTAWFNKNPNL